MDETQEKFFLELIDEWLAVMIEDASPTITKHTNDTTFKRVISIRYKALKNIKIKAKLEKPDHKAFETWLSHRIDFISHVAGTTQNKAYREKMQTKLFAYKDVADRVKLTAERIIELDKHERSMKESEINKNILETITVRRGVCDICGKDMKKLYINNEFVAESCPECYKKVAILKVKHNHCDKDQRSKYLNKVRGLVKTLLGFTLDSRVS